MDATFTVCCAKIAVAGIIIATAAINLIVNLLFTVISPNNIKTVKPKLKCELLPHDLLACSSLARRQLSDT
jgi:hypothetical protein